MFIRKFFRLTMSILVPVMILSACCSKTDIPRVLLITGGHSYDTTEFFHTFFSMKEFRVDTLSQPAAKAIILNGEISQYDAVVFYDMWPEISLEEQAAFIDMTEQGIPLLFLHHSLASYQHWEEYSKIVGGQYIADWAHEDTTLWSDYQHDIIIDVEILDPDHPVLNNISAFSIHDEGYSNLFLEDGIHPLLGTSTPDCHPVIAWVNSYRNSEVIYLIFGHDKQSYQNENFRLLVQNALSWLTAAREPDHQ